MEMTTLGKTGLKVSRLGVGLAELGGLSLDKVEQAGRVLGGALDAGLNFLDTAGCYGNSEELIGRTVSHRRQEFVLATKAGHAVDDYPAWTAQATRDGIDRSLVRLRTDHVDILQVHAYDISPPPPDEVVQVVMDAKKAGKTRFVGYTQQNEHAEWAVRSGLFDTLQTSFNLVDQRARHGLFQLAESRGIGIIVKRPIATAVWGEALSPVDGEGRASEPRLDRARAMAGLGPIPGAPRDPIVLALGFILAHEEVHTAIVGTRNPEHMLANIEAVENQIPILDSVVEELHRRFDLLGGDWPSIE